VAFVGQVGNDFVEREAFQEIDYRRMYGPMTKWVAQIDRTERIPEYVSHAFHTAMSGRPGPVLLALPEDMLFAQAAVADVPHYKTVRPAPSSADLHELQKMLQAAERPFVIIGGGGWDRASCDGLRAWLEQSQLAAGTSFRCQDLLDSRSASFAGDVGIGINPKLAQRIREADVVLVVGARLGEMTTGGYALFEAPVPAQKLIHVHGGAEELGRVYHAALPINSGMARFVAALATVKLDGARWAARTQQARADYLAWSEPQPISGCSTRTSCAGSRTTCPRTRSSRAARATSRAGCTASSATRDSARSWARPMARWAAACPRRSPRSSPRRSARWWRSRATATSS
jgi:acetolactate synthase-1/2/3 large subunit